MARKVFLSILGTNHYLETRYYFGKEPIGDEKITRFVQTATMGKECSDWGIDDAAYIFVTEEAQEKNWNDPAQKGYGKNEYTGLSKLVADFGFKFSSEAVLIPDGLSEKEIWEIFETVFNKLKDGDELYFDITHSFRSIPMLVMVLINYARFLKNIKVAKIYYGAFEKLGPAYKVKDIPVEDRLAPVLDITSFSELQDWTNAAASFIETGNTYKIAELLENEELTKLFHKFSDIHFVARGKELYEGKIPTELAQKLKNYDANIHPPFEHIKEKVINRLEKYNNNLVNNGLTSIKFCIDHNLIQQGYTLMDEFMITYVLVKTSYDWSLQINRDVASSCLNLNKKEAFNIGMFEQNLQKKYPDKENRNVIMEKIEKIVDSIFNLTEKKKLNQIMMSISHGGRNDINHAGMRENPRSADKFRKSLLKHYKALEDIIKNSTN
jgi:CRISPR-associated Csx2 family protein